jgi:hypothetical protein
VSVGSTGLTDVQSAGSDGAENGSVAPSCSSPRITFVIEHGAETTQDRAVVPWSSVGYGRAPAEIDARAARPPPLEGTGVHP